eukprot:CAMPEP_0115879346 /NCGR_PEP_ID=MMETSP0287-20121206/27269_1 /TAXON_ID=412157 /ORGANISM="Chrysochromulina rotalis, Strain UIO044" /LENGTH=147 /DNA_ID=CAMNT_0003335045 /DNA_START=72 /DNA_END=512 /DNA_ORIENTATION=+
MEAVLRLLAAASRGRNNPCRGDQTLFQPWFSRRHTRCMPHSLNCRDPRLQADGTDEAATLSRCLDDDRGRRSLAMPHVMHFACGTMPRPNTADFLANATIYARAWLTHLDRARAHIAAMAASAGGEAMLVGINQEGAAAVVLPGYNP